MTLTIKKAKKAITRPTIAYVRRERAAVTFVLSPPEVTHMIPPQIKKMSARITTRISIIVTALPIAEEVVFNPPCGSPAGGLTVSPPGSVSARYFMFLAYKVVRGKSRGRLRRELMRMIGAH